MPVIDTATNTDPKYRLALRGLSGGTLATAPVSAAGTGFTSQPTVSVTGGAGMVYPAVVRANLTPVGIDTVFVVTLGGSGYKSTPTVRFVSVDGNGSGATATATVAGGVVTGITRTAAGSGYTQPPQMVIEGGEPARNAEATCRLTATTVASLSILNPGLGYTAVPTITITGGGGSGATCTTPTITAQATLATVVVDYMTNDMYRFSVGGRLFSYDGADAALNALLKAVFTGAGGFAATDKTFGTTA